MSGEMIAAVRSATQVTFAPRPRYQATTFAEIERIAQVILDSGSYPPNCSNINKIVMMILAGNDIGLSPMQSMASITPPINGKCALFGDMGLALVRASGALEVFAERVEGHGDERTAYTRIKRAGFPEKEFAYTMAQAKRLRSYQAAIKPPGGGPWYEDPDNMLQWRARWRAIRSEFTDVLNGMGGVEEQEDANDGDTITVEATPSTTQSATTTQQPDASPSPPTPPAIAPASGKPTPTDVQIAEIVRLKKLFLPGSETKERNERWNSELAQFNVTTAKDLTPEQADEFIHTIGVTCDPFTYPATSM